jgi:hypothetical protein
MDISASDVYRLTAEQLRKFCLDRGLDCKGSIKLLRQRLSQQIKSSKIQMPGASTDLGDVVVDLVLQTLGEVFHGNSGGGQV